MESSKTASNPRVPRRVRLTVGPQRERAPAERLRAPAQPEKASGLQEPLSPKSKEVDNLQTRAVGDPPAREILTRLFSSYTWKHPKATSAKSCSPRWQTLKTCLSAGSSFINFGDLYNTPSETLDSSISLAEESEVPSPQSPYLTILNEYMSPEMITRLERTVKKRAVIALKTLTKQKQESQMKQQPLLQESKQLLEEKLHVYNDSKFFVDYLNKINEQRKKKHQELWEEYFQQCGAIEQKRQELVSQYRKRNTDLKAQLMQGRKKQFNAKRQLQTASHITKIKEKQNMKLEALKEETAQVLMETSFKDQSTHFEFLECRELLAKKLKQLDIMQRGKNQTRELKKKAKALELTARQVHLNFCYDVNAANRQIRKELQELTQQYQKLNSVKNQLKTQKQMLKEEQWYLEALKKGRQRLQAQRKNNDNVCSTVQIAPRVPRSHSLGAKSRINPKGFLQLAME
ncbi:coiled-coil domain-containing protein 121-like [Dipodomys merriami]|uniref:coiled-coil domain-containing protein 121-like n=1 Tax=Dipodomys merriami TaxID=94247 RepID=UPI00384CF114